MLDQSVQSAEIPDSMPTTSVKLTAAQMRDEQRFTIETSVDRWRADEQD